MFGTDDHGQSVLILGLSQPDGSYSFGNLRPGTYAVTINTPTGYLDGKEAVGSAGGSLATRRINGIVLASNTSATANNFGEVLTSSLSGYAFNDGNDDGTRQPTEGGIGGVPVTLSGTDDNGASVSLSTTTSTADGSYSFANVRPGTYSLAAGSPPAYLDGSTVAGSPGGTATNRRISAIALGQGVAGLENDFASIRPATLSGVVFEDSNGDGAREVSEHGLAGVTLTLTGTDDLGRSVSTTATTASDGTYAFTSLRPGTYTATETPPPGEFDGKVSAGSAGGMAGPHQVSAITLAPGLDASGYDFAHHASTSLGGFVFNDGNDDGAKAATEAGLGGVVVTLTGTENAGNPVSLTTSTAPDGSYQFANLQPGTYAMSSTTPGGYLAGKTSGTGCGCSDPTTLAMITVNSGEAIADEDFGKIHPASLVGSVFVDLNGDGIQQPGEPGQSGVNVTLDGTDDLGNAVSEVATTDSAGHYTFVGLRPGHYSLSDLRPESYSGEIATVGSLGGKAGADVVLDVLPGAGQVGFGYNFALLGATITGQIAVDPGDGSGLTTGLAGASVTLEDSSGHVLATTTSQDDGSYLFSDVAVGNDVIAFSVPSGYGVTTASTRSVVVPLAGLSNENFAVSESALSGFVYNDANDNGVQGSGEVGLANVVIALTGQDVNGQPVAMTATSASDGSFHFSRLLAGNYALSDATPAGYLDGLATPGTLAGFVHFNRLSAIHVGPGARGASYNFATLMPSMIAGVAYADGHHDGLRHADDRGIAGMAITLTGTDDLGQPVTRNSETANDGSYSFADLRPGNYAVLGTTPSQYANGPADAGTAGGQVGQVAISEVPLVSGTAAAAYDFAAEGSDVSGVVFDDLPNLGTYQAGEPGVAGASVQLIASNGTVVASSVTGADGRYLFSAMPAGSYSISVDRPNPDGTPTRTVRALSLQPGVASAESFAATVASGVISGTVFADRADNGIPGPGDFGLPGVAVSLTGTDALGRSVSEVSSTDPSGNYSFTALSAGSYSVAVEVPSGYLIDKASPTIQAVNLTQGQTTSTNFAALPPSSVSGVVYLDSDSTGVFSTNDYGVASVPIALTGRNDLGQTVTETTSTNADGRYSFADLRPGAYAVTRGASPAFTSGPSNVGSFGGVASKLQISQIALAGGSTAQSYNFAERIKPGCTLNTPGVRAVITQGSHPTGPVATVTSAKKAGKTATTSHVSPVSHSKITHYVPRLAARLGKTH